MGRTLVLDIETNGLLYPQVDRKGVALMRGDHIHCLVAIDADTKEEFFQRVKEDVVDKYNANFVDLQDQLKTIKQQNQTF